MRKLIALLVVVVAFASCTEQKGPQFTINGNLEGVTEGSVYLKKMVGGEIIIVDSTAVEAAGFTFINDFTVAERVYITFQNHANAEIAFFIEENIIDVKGKIDDLTTVVVTGSDTEDLHRAYKQTKTSYYDIMEALYPQYEKAHEDNDEVLIAELEGKYEKVDDELNAYVKKFILENGNSVVSAYLTIRNSSKFELEDLKEIAANFTDEIKSSFYVESVNERINILTASAIGQKAPAFSQMRQDSTMFDLASLEGKWVLVDFWASWCGPCRAENPNVVATFNQFKDKNFTVLGVSFDSDRERWLQAIIDDNLTWEHVSDLKGWANVVGKKYGVQAIPQNVLLDPNGVIVAKNLRGEDLGAKLTELIK